MTAKISSERTRYIIYSLFLLLACLIIFYPSLHYQFIGLDDNELVVRNPDIKILSIDRLFELVRRPYITLFVPLTMLTYVADYQVWHLDPFGYKFTNLLLHFLNSILVMRLIGRIQKEPFFGFMVALLFAIHPVQIESVVWIAERKNVLSAFFFFLALSCYFRACREISESEERKIDRKST